MKNLSLITKNIFSLLLLALLLSCGGSKKKNPTTKKNKSEKESIFDLQAHKTKSGFRESLLKSEKELEKRRASSKMSPIPKLSKLIISPPPPVIGGDKLISFSVSDNIPLKDVLIELARVAKIDIDLDPKISGGIVINAQNRPLKEIIDRIASLGNLRYTYKNGVLHFESDTAFIKNYFVDYLSSSSLWGDVESNIQVILQSTAPRESSSNSSSLLSDSSGLSEFSPSTATSSATSNKSAGIINVFATNKQHKAIEKYLADVERSSSAQVLIEAKMVEVALNEEYKAGIDWSRISPGGSGGNAFSISNNGSATAPFTGTLTNIFGAEGLSASVSALEKFGTARALSSPRIHAINNQKATLDFANKLVYFKIEADQSAASNGASANAAVVSTTVTSTKLEEDVGVNLEIIPSINILTNEVTLNIKPKITESSRTVTDPASNNSLVTEKNEVPVIQTREIETTAKIKSGNIIVIGGLMKENATNDEQSVPILAKIPVFGWMFKSLSKKSEITETVIFLKATIIKSTTPPSKYDRELQRDFDSTKREFFN